MTAVRPAVGARIRAGLLTDGDRPAFAKLLERDPVVNAVVQARFEASGSLSERLLGGTAIGVYRGDELAGACFSGGNLVPLSGDERTWPLLAAFVGNRPRICSSIVGRADAVEAMWSLLSRTWGPSRGMRTRQPLLVTDDVATVAADGEVHQVRPDQLDRYVPAAAAMFADELGQSPYVAPGGAAFRRRIAELIGSGHAFARVDFRGQVMFKAELGAVSTRTAQIQGVWVRPDLRGRGLGAAGLAAVIAHALTLAPTVSLYVNDFNAAALRMYAKLGMREHATLSTVLL